MITVIGLGPGSLDRVPTSVMGLLEDAGNEVIARTRHHPAAAELAELRAVTFCDDLYQSADRFDDVYELIAARVLEAGTRGDVIYAVPGSPMVGEFAVRKILDSGEEVEVVPGESFIDAILAEVGYDPLDRGLQILNGHDLADPLVVDKPTIVGHLDNPQVLGDVADAVSRVIPEGTEVTVLSGLGAPNAMVVRGPIDQIDSGLGGLRTSMFIDCEPAGLIGAVRVMRRLREECPWDIEQTHQSLVKNLIEETYELVEAIGDLPSSPDEDWVAYAAVEDELGDVLLQVLFHEAIGRESGVFDIDGIGGVLREKLIRRHPHVFGDATVGDADEVKRNWDRIKAGETGDTPDSVLDGLPGSLPALQRASKLQNRAAKVGFDWSNAAEVMPRVGDELAELAGAIDGPGDVGAELGDVIFTVINLARHLGVDTEMALHGANSRFEERFRQMESEGPLDGLDLDELNARWERAKTVP